MNMLLLVVILCVGDVGGGWLGDGFVEYRFFFGFEFCLVG